MQITLKATLKTTITHLLILTLFWAGLSLAQTKEIVHKTTPPQTINLVYEVLLNGKPLATVTESYQQVGNEYHVLSVTKGIGFYALKGERQLTSDGLVTAEGLKPLHFELRQGDNAKKWLATDFDWVNNKLNMTIKGELKTEPLVLGTQDLASFPYQIMRQFIGPTLVAGAAQKEPNTITLNVSTGKNVREYHYKVAARDVVLTLAAGTFKTVHLVSVEVDPASREGKQLWFASEQFYVPVRILMTDSNGAVIEQSLKSLQLE